MSAPPTSESAPVLASSGLRLLPEALPEALRPYVLEVYEEAIPALPPAPLRLPVSASTVAIYNVTLHGHAEITVASGGRFTMPPFILSAPQPEAYVAEVFTALRGFYVTLRAVAPLAVLGVRRPWPGPPAPLPATDGLVRPALADATRAFEAGLLAAPDFEGRAALTLAFLRDALAAAPEADVAEAAFLQRAVDEIERSGGQVRAGALAGALGVSPSTLRRRFAVVGMPVKRFAEITRFRQAHAFLASTPGATWADAVHRFGYADQPHFVRDYRRFSGTPPTRWDPHAHAIDVRMGIEGDGGELGGTEGAG